MKTARTLITTLLSAALTAGPVPAAVFGQKMEAKNAKEAFYNTFFNPSSKLYKDRVAEEAAKTPYERNTDLLNAIIGGMHINNTVYTPPIGHEIKSIRNIDERISALLRYTTSTAEVRIYGIHGFYPARYNLNGNAMAEQIRTIVEREPSKRTYRALVPFLTNYKVHEYAYAEALIGLAKLSALGKVEDKAKLDAALKEDLDYLLSFRFHEIVYGSGKEFDTLLRGRIKEALVLLGAKPTQNPASRAKVAQVTSSFNDIFAKVQIGLTAISLLSMAGGGFKSLSSMPKAAPTANLRPVATPALRPSAGGGIRIGNTPSYAFEGSAALKPNYQAAPANLRIINAAPIRALNAQAQPTIALMPYAQKFQQYHAAAAPKIQAAVKPQQAQPLLTDAEPIHLGDPVKKKTREDFDKERADRIERDLNSDYTLPGQHSLSEINSLSVPFQLKSKLTILFQAKASKGSTTWDQTATHSEQEIRNRYQTPAEVSYEFIEKHEQDLQKYYSLTPNYIEGYYQRRIYPYLNKVTYTADGQELYRGMYMTTAELKTMLKQGIDINLTRWHTGAKDNKPIISSSLSSREAVSYIFQSNIDKASQNAIGVVVKLKNNGRHSLFEDTQLNATNTIYHAYSSIPPQEIEAVYIYGPYGLETLEAVGDKIKSGNLSNDWIKAFDRGSFMR